MVAGFVGPAKNILIYMIIIGNQIPEPKISIQEYFFSELENCQKHIRTVTNKFSIKKLLAKGGIVCQIKKRADSKAVKEINKNQIWSKSLFSSLEKVHFKE